MGNYGKWKTIILWHTIVGLCNDRLGDRSTLLWRVDDTLNNAWPQHIFGNVIVLRRMSNFCRSGFYDFGLIKFTK